MLEISIAFVLKLYSLNVIKNQIESLRIESNRDIWINTQPYDLYKSWYVHKIRMYF